MKKIDGIVNTDKKKQVEEKALAACYALQAPRHLEIEKMNI
jgi:hypothetical protein